MSSQKALILPEKQGKWKVGEKKIPTPGPKDVLVKITATALNHMDWSLQVYAIFAHEFPFTFGTDAAGIVEEVGSELTNLAKGDRIFFQGGFNGKDSATFQQYCIVPAELTAKIPPNISDDQAASIPLALATVVTGIWGHTRTANLPAPWEEGGFTKFANKPAFILGGASSVGQYAIQMARVSKHSPIIATASLHHEALLKSLGATHVIDRSLAHGRLLAEVKKITGGAPVEYVYDAVSQPGTQALGYEALAPGGTLLIVFNKDIYLDRKPHDGKKVVHLHNSAEPAKNRAVRVELYKRLTEWLETGVLIPNRVEVLPDGLGGILDGLARLKANKVRGVKLIARPQETP